MVNGRLERVAMVEPPEIARPLPDRDGKHRDKAIEELGAQALEVSDELVVFAAREWGTSSRWNIFPRHALPTSLKH